LDNDICSEQNHVPDQLSKPLARPIKARVGADGTIHLGPTADGTSLLYSLDEIPIDHLCCRCSTGYIALMLSLAAGGFNESAEPETLLVISGSGRWTQDGAIEATGGQGIDVVQAVVNNWEHEYLTGRQPRNQVVVTLLAHVPTVVARWATDVFVYTTALAAAARRSTSTDDGCEPESPSWTAVEYPSFNGDLAGMVAVVHGVWDPCSGTEAADSGSVVAAALSLL